MINAGNISQYLSSIWIPWNYCFGCPISICSLKPPLTVILPMGLLVDWSGLIGHLFTEVTRPRAGGITYILRIHDHEHGFRPSAVWQIQQTVPSYLPTTYCSASANRVFSLSPAWIYSFAYRFLPPLIMSGEVFTRQCINGKLSNQFLLKSTDCHRSWSAAGLALLLYDYILTWQREIQLVSRFLPLSNRIHLFTHPSVLSANHLGQSSRHFCWAGISL